MAMEKRNLLNKILLLTIFMVVFNQGNATHIAGGDLTYSCVAPNTYEITLSIFRDCSGIAMGTFSLLTFASATCDTIFDTISLVSSTEVSQLCPSDLPYSYCNGPPKLYPGMERYLFIDTIVLPDTCVYELYAVGACCRNWAINIDMNFPLVFPGDIKMHSWLDNTLECNNSPVFMAQPLPYVCIGQEVRYNLGANDIDGDSLVYSFIEPINGLVGPISYIPPYSVNEPIVGIQLDSTTGEMIFTADTIGNYVVAVKVDEYDRTGNYKGYIMRDFQVVAIDCSNTPPDPNSGVITNLDTSNTATQTGNYSIEVCNGGSFSFDIQITDTDTTDTINLLSNVTTVFPGATFTKSSGNPATATISATLSGNLSYKKAFIVYAQDDYCPIPGIQYYTYDVNIISGTSAGPDRVLCDSTMQAQLNATGGDTFTWNILSGDINSLSCNLCANPVASPDSTTIYEVVSNFDTSLAACKNRDTIIIVVLDSIFNPTIISVTPFCETDTPVFLTAAYEGGIWSGTGIVNSATGLFSPATAGAGTHVISYHLSATCGDTDTVSIIVNAVPIATIDPAGFYCADASPDTLTAVEAGGIWSGTGITDAVNGTFDPIIAGVGMHVITYVISGTCSDTDTLSIIVNTLPNATIISDGPYDILELPNTLQGSPAGGTWFGTGITDPADGIFDPTLIGIADTFIIYYTITDSNGCSDTTSKTFIVIEDVYLDIPTAFTPNNNDKNEIIYLKAKGYTEVEFKIFNRWGELVFETNDASIGWNGTYKGKQQPMGLYIYYVRVIDFSGEKIVLQGNITLIR